jgi:hypothetical protein
VATIDISEREGVAIGRVLAYWVGKWDWECPTLFGLELAEMKAVADNWQSTLRDDDELAAAAVLGGFREFLFGASAVPKSKVEALSGIKYEEAVALGEKLRAALHHAL